MFLVISDIHGSYDDLLKVVDLFTKEDFKKIIICGDVLNHGPRNKLPMGYNPQNVATLLNKFKNDILCIRGNCDSEVDQMILDFPITADYSYYSIANRNIFISHGHLYSPENLPPLSKNDIFLYGHTHIPEAKLLNHAYILNPGSISIPKGNSAKSYGVLDSKGFTVYSLERNEIITSIEFN